MEEKIAEVYSSFLSRFLQGFDANENGVFPDFSEEGFGIGERGGG